MILTIAMVQNVIMFLLQPGKLSTIELVVFGIYLTVSRILSYRYYYIIIILAHFAGGEKTREVAY